MRSRLALRADSIGRGENTMNRAPSWLDRYGAPILLLLLLLVAVFG